MTGGAESDWAEFRAERIFPVTLERTWHGCTTASELERWWSPLDLQTTVVRLDLRPGGAIHLRVRYVPALVGPQSAEMFRAAGVPIAFELRGRFEEVAPTRRLAFRLALDLGRSAAGVESSHHFAFASQGSSSRVTLVAGGRKNPHWTSLGQANVEGQLERLGAALAAEA